MSSSPAPNAVQDGAGNVRSSSLPSQRRPLTAEERAAVEYTEELEKARRDCIAYKSFSLEGNKFFGGGILVGGLLSSLAPNQWPTRTRALPFFVLGLGGIIADFVDNSIKCADKFPDQFHTNMTATASTPDTSLSQTTQQNNDNR